MDRPLKLVEFIIGCIVFIISILMMLYNSGTKNGEMLQMNATQNMRLDKVEQQMKEDRETANKDRQELYNKLDKMNDSQTSILILLQNKQDRQ